MVMERFPELPRNFEKVRLPCTSPAQCQPRLLFRYFLPLTRGCCQRLLQPGRAAWDPSSVTAVNRDLWPIFDPELSSLVALAPGAPCQSSLSMEFPIFAVEALYGLLVEL